MAGGKADVILKEFWRNNERFADLFNAVVFEGEQVLKPEDLQEMDTDMSGTIHFKDYEESLVRMRDVVKKTAFGVEFAVLGIESQKAVSYAMPLRTLLYDGMGYLKEYQEITRSRKAEKGKRTQGEFLSGMRKEDRLHPIISIVVYYSEAAWDGPMSLKDMIVEMPEAIEKIFADYKMNLVQVRKSDQYTFHNADVKTVFEVSRAIYDGNFDKIARQYNEDMDEELLRVIGTITDYLELKNLKTEKGVGNVCTALEKLKEDVREETRKETFKEATNKRDQEWISRLTKEGFSASEIARIMGASEEEVRKLQKG
ncbi:MAG: Rpn family recombination-promoting nuclease/putative transposase [Eubacteriales bacterium]|nr:Rpn family recombination-promoting nuclease/putative transposase [Eubacteriales bacterium]